MFTMTCISVYHELLFSLTNGKDMVSMCLVRCLGECRG